MIIREWRIRAKTETQEAFPARFRDHVLPGLRRLSGFAGATVSRRTLGDKVEFLVLTRWDSMDAVRAFAGDDPARAVVDPGVAPLLTDFDPSVAHYEVVVDDR